MRPTALVLLACLSCGDPPCPPVAREDDPLPLRVGHVWIYDESGGPVPGVITKTVTGTEELAGQPTFVWQTEQTNSAVVKRANWHDDGQRVVRLRQERYGPSGLLLSAREYEPGFLRFDRSFDEVGEELTERHTRLEFDSAGNLVRSVSKQYNWRVEAVGEAVRVPLGEFSALRVRRTDVDQGTVKTYWYTRGVGKILEVDPLETEALTEYALAL